MAECLRFLLLALGLLLLTMPLRAQSTKVDVLLEQGEYAAAAKILEAGGDRQSRYDAGVAFIDADSLTAALRNLNAATRDEGGKFVRDSLSGLAYHKMGVAAYAAYQDSLSTVFYRRAIAIRDSVLPRYHNQRAHSRSNLAQSLNALGQPDEALVLLREANDIFEGVPQADSLNWLRGLNQVTTAARNTRNHRLGYSSSIRAVSLVEQMDVGDADAFFTYYQAAFVMLRLDEIDAALRYARECVAYARLSGMQKFLPDALNMLAIVEREAGKIEAGYRHLREAESAAWRVGDTVTLGYAYLNLAEYYGGKRERKNLERYDALAREFLQYKGKEADYFRSEKTPAALLAMGEPERALGLLNERVTALGGGVRDSITRKKKPIDPLDLVPLIDLLGHRAEAYTRLDQNDLALEDYRLLFDLQNQLRQDLTDDVSRAYLSRDLRRFFDRAIALLLELYAAEEEDDDLWEAFQLSERARAYSLLASVQSRYRGISPEISALQAGISQMEREVSLGREDLRDELAAARIRMDRLQAAQHDGNAISFALKRKRLNSYLKDANTHLVQYHISDLASVVFLITPAGELQVHKLEADDELGDEINAWRAAIEGSSYRLKSMASRGVQAGLDSLYLNRGLALSELLVPVSVRKVLHLRPAANYKTRVCIVPDGVLNYLPFAALPLSDAPLPLDYAKLDYLQTAADLSYSYSSSYLLEVTEGARRTYENNFVAFAPSFYAAPGVTAAAAGGEQTARNVLRSNATLAPLVYSKPEVATVTSMVEDGRAYYDAQANIEKFRMTAGTARILHISSHGFVDPTDPNLSFVAFTQSADTLQKDQLLYFNDLYGLRIDNELTVLSACETNVGKLAAGETTMSMASAFAAAGARSTLTTLWQVDDAATKDLIVSFYRSLVEGDTRLEALNAAQRNLCQGRDYAHPYYWSALTLYGASSPIELLGKGVTLSSFAWVILWLCAASAFVLFIYVGRGKKELRNPGDSRGGRG